MEFTSFSRISYIKILYLRVLHSGQQVQILQNEVRQLQLVTIIQQNDLIEDRLYEVLEEVRQLKNNDIEMERSREGG